MADSRALLLTDVVDSTKLSEALGDAAMAEVWAQHDRVARDLLPAWRGREIDKTDGMLLLFDAAADAVAYALAYHAALAALPVPLKARAGLHVGAVILRENTAADVARGAKPLEVDGLAKPTAARVMSLARGAQTLLTAEARDDLGKSEWKLQSHGHWQVKGVAEPIELFEVGAPAARFAAPSDSEKVFRVVRAGEWWLPVRDIPNNLPHQANSFIGRELELDEVTALLAQTRLVTLLGMGGLGKTRLSLEVAALQMPLFPDGVFFLDLAPLRDGALVAAEAAQVLDVAEEPGRSLLQSLCAHLKSRRVLLVLDNCEHLIKACAELAHAVVRAAPFVRLIASSREPLHVPGERSYPILPLPLPDRRDDADALARSAAVRLFVERAQAHKPSFALHDAGAAAVADLVARLEGIPLALELAAARVRSMSVADINLRLKDRYKLLTGGARVLQQRQQTLRALVDWSYELLDTNEQTLLARLSVFAGGFDLDAAEKVCGAEPIDEFDVLDLLGSLVDKSLAMLDESGEQPRYRMLDTIREYAHEKLEQAESDSATATRHCDYFFDLAKQARRGSAGPQQADWLKRLELELDNLRAAIALALAGTVDPFIAVKFAVALQGFWLLRGYCGEGRRLVKAALALPAIDKSELAQAHALYVGAALAEGQSDHVEALQMLERCLELRRILANPVEIAATLSTLTPARLQAGDALGAGIGEHEALDIFRHLGDRVGEAIALLHLGEIAMFDGDDGEAVIRLGESLAIAREVEYREVEGECNLLLGQLAIDAGDEAAARTRLQASLQICREAFDKRGEANASWRLGRLLLQGDAPASAREPLSQALGAFRAFEMWGELLGCLEDHALLADRLGQSAIAGHIAAAACAARERLQLARAPRAEAYWQRCLSALRRGPGLIPFEAAWAEAQTGLELDDALRSALALPA